MSGLTTVPFGWRVYWLTWLWLGIAVGAARIGKEPILPLIPEHLHEFVRDCSRASQIRRLRDSNRCRVPRSLLCECPATGKLTGSERC